MCVCVSSQLAEVLNGEDRGESEEKDKSIPVALSRTGNNGEY